MGLFSDIVAAVEGSGGALAGDTSGASLFGFFATVTNGAMWRSLGWLLLGIAMLGAGIVLWLKSEAVRGLRG